MKWESPKRIRCFWKIAFIREVVVSFILTLLSNEFQMKRKIILTMLFFLKNNRFFVIGW